MGDSSQLLPLIGIMVLSKVEQMITMADHLKSSVLIIELY